MDACQVAVDERLAEQALAAAGRIDARLRDLDAARADFQRAVRALYLDGGSMREIAELLGLSHQRVHQLLDMPRQGEVSRARRRKWGGRAVTCSFCGREQRRVAKLITGQGGAGICNECVGLADRVVEGQAAETDIRTTITPAVSGICSFCGKRAGEGARPVRIAAADDGAAGVCDECLALSHEILTDEPVR